MTSRSRSTTRASARRLRAAMLAAAVSALAVPYAHAQPEAPAQANADSTRSSFLSNTSIHFYTDVGFGKPLQEKLPAGGLQAGTYSFQIADLHLFATSKLSDDWNVLGELLITSDFTNDAAAEMDRLLVQYAPNKHLRLGIGKYNSGVGYYPNQFHRAKFYQTATGRPLMFTDEDNGGILPVHQVGLTAQGEIPSGALGLHYLGEIGNGRSYDPHNAAIQNWADENNLKAVNGGLFIKPDALPALDIGFSVYRDRIEINDVPKMRETITAVHVVWNAPDLEFLNEAVIVRHTPETQGETVTTKDFYTQLSRRFDRVRPYVRWEYQNAPATDPLFALVQVAPPIGERNAVSLGLRLDIAPLVVFKIQFDRAQQYGVWASGTHAQVAVAF